MKNAKIFLINDQENSLTPMPETSYDSEDILQKFLALYPDLLPGDQITPEDPRRWLLVSREMGVPGNIDETGRWSLDHLFLDQDGIPTFVECKRSSDTRGRREVVAQMLDYAANGTEYWSIDRLRQAATETSQVQGKSLDIEIQRMLEQSDELDVEAYWTQVEENLKSGKVRLIFASDEIPKELRRLVEFLNEKLIDIEVLAVEVKQYIGDGPKALVPRVIGITEAARRKKPASSQRHTTREEFLAKCTPAAARFFRTVLDGATERGHDVYWGTVGFSARVFLSKEDRHASFVYGYPPDLFQFYFAHFPFTEELAQSLREELMGFGLFAPAGEKTLKTRIDETNLDNARRTLDFIFKKMNELHEVF